MEFAPVIIFAYNRAEHFTKTVSALAQCQEAKNTQLFVFCDGAKNDSAVEAVQAVRNAAHSIDKSLFMKTTVIESAQNKGLARSIISGVTDIINMYEKVIVLEDDNIVSPYFLKYMNGCLDFYEKNKKIGAIAGFSPDVNLPSSYKYDMYLAYRSCSCAWASWKDRWANIDWDLESIDELYKNPELLKRLNSNGNDRFIRLYRQVKGNKDSWSIRFGYHLVKNDMLTVYPKFSYVSNIGADNSGVHSSTDDAGKLEIDIKKAIPDPKFEEMVLDQEIQKRMKSYYSDGLMSDVKRTIATKAIILKQKFKR